MPEAKLLICMAFFWNARLASGNAQPAMLPEPDARAAVKNGDRGHAGRSGGGGAPFRARFLPEFMHQNGLQPLSAMRSQLFFS
jgi:hypothetical protein